MTIPRLIVKAGLLLLTNMAAAQTKPDKPDVTPHMKLDMNILMQHLPVMTNHWVEDWADIHILESCKTLTKQFGFRPEDMYTFNVHYDDCDPPWIFCRHKDSVVSKDDVINLWSRIPVGMRENIRHIGIWPSIPGAAGRLSSTRDVDIAAGSYNLAVLIHEVGHGVDMNLGNRDHGAYISNTPRWREYYGYDDYVVTPYSRGSWLEHFAELMQYTIYDRIVPGGLNAIYPEGQGKIRN